MGRSLGIYRNLFIYLGQVIDNETSEDELFEDAFEGLGDLPQFQDALEDLGDLTQYLQDIDLDNSEENRNDVIGEKLNKIMKEETIKNLERVNQNEISDQTFDDLKSTAVTAHGAIHVDQLYNLPLTKFHPQLENEIKVRRSVVIPKRSIEHLKIK